MKRSQWEQWFKEFFDGIAEVDERLVSHITFPAGKTAREILPELYNEPFRLDIYSQQLAEFLPVYEEVVKVSARLEQEARKCLSGSNQVN